jgi:putative flippase GtrA
MKQLVEALARHSPTIRWALVGISTFLIDYIIFLKLYSNTSSVLFSNFVSGVFSIVFNYLSNYFWSFNSQSDHSKSGLKYLVNLIIIWGVNTFLIKFLILAGIQENYAKLIPALIIAPFSFFSLKFIVFKK